MNALPDLGEWFLSLGFSAAAMQGGALFMGVPFGPVRRQLVRTGAIVQLGCAASALFVLMMLRVTDDFSVLNVALHSNRTLPLLYKIVGAWGNHEGSMVLWVLVLALYGAFLGRSSLGSAAQAVQGLLGAGALLFILCTSDPFLRVFPAPADGEALNPLLQDLGLAMHPPLLYLGYVGFSTAFSLAVAALLLKAVDRDFARAAQPWILAAWSALTLGIGLGSWWAYRELGWGGFWFWDPVENASLLPWLAGTALLHANMALARRGTMAAAVPLLAVLTFGMSLIGTFLVRSGLITSVHGFASDPGRGTFILAYIVVTVGGALLLYALRGVNSEKPRAPFLSGEGMIVLNTVFFVAMAGTVLLGTVYPLALEALGGPPISVGASYFDRTVLPLLVIPLLLAATGPLAGWGKPDWTRLAARLFPALLAALAAALLVLATAKREAAVGALGMALAAWLGVASLARLRRGLTIKNGGGALAHLGMALAVMGVVATVLWQQGYSTLARPGDAFDFAGRHYVYAREEAAHHANHDALIAVLETEGGALTPEYRRYFIRDTALSIAAIRSRPWADLYAVIGAPEKGGVPLRLYRNPLMQALWLGCMLMCGGGALAALSYRRKR